MANKKPAGSKDQPIENFMKPMASQPVNYVGKWADAIATVRRADEARVANIAKNAAITQNAKLVQQSLNASGGSSAVRSSAASSGGRFSSFMNRLGGGLRSSGR